MTVHLHGPVSGPVCGAPWPTDRKRETTAWRSDVTCPACLATLTPPSVEHYIVGTPEGRNLRAVCGVTVPIFPLPVVGSPRCPDCEARLAVDPTL